MYGKRLWIHNSADPERPSNSAGVAFVLNRDVVSTKSCNVTTIEKGRAIAITLPWHDRDTVTLLNVYAPNEPGRHAAFWGRIERMRRENEIPQVDFMLGDFNIVEDDIDRAPPRAELDSAATALRDCRRTLRVYDAWRAENPATRNYTFISRATGSMSRLDRIYVAEKRRTSVFEWVCQTPGVVTDHRIVWMKYAPTTMPYMGPGRWTWPSGLTNETHTISSVEKIGMRLQENLNRLRGEGRTGERNPQTLWQEFKDRTAEMAALLTGAALSRTSRKLASKEYALATEMNREEAGLEDGTEPRRNIALME
ncbi:DNase I-like protein, partial [Punctularia strigosozonata HHB-11173 SS5]|uniref:DNase I-like protein n=1 Tax=Punctularia strigosozonata (strain HHB-11173) TaxID=741275 RepID=UPI00044177FE